MIIIRRSLFILFLFTCFAAAQEQENPLKIFGYFQNSFGQQTYDNTKNYNSFNLQQLNVLFQKDLLEDWTAFINFQAVNNFSAERQWGSFSIEEAWIRYSSNNHFNLKLGLQIPVFNRLNEIKNRSPLLPYVIIPLVYEDSFSEDIDIESYIPKRAFLQFYGYWPVTEDFKLDYALYLGNSPNISRWSDRGNSGQDTTDTILSGGRIGFRYHGLKTGFSYTSDQVTNFAKEFTDSMSYPEIFEAHKQFFGKLIHRNRIGFDFSLEYKDWLFESEYIDVLYDDKSDVFDLNRRFYYGTLGYQFTEELFSYISYWYVKEKYLPVISQSFRIYTGGAAYSLSDIVTLKIQLARVKFEYVTNVENFNTNVDFNYYAAAVSVFF